MRYEIEYIGECECGSQVISSGEKDNTDDIDLGVCFFCKNKISMISKEVKEK